jgi:hypothetical protein
VDRPQLLDWLRADVGEDLFVDDPAIAFKSLQRDITRRPVAAPAIEELPNRFSCGVDIDALDCFGVQSNELAWASRLVPLNET